MDFTFDAYAQLVKKTRENGYNITSYKTYGQNEREVILRHDVDVSLEQAALFSQFERQLGVSSTYFILISSNNYNIFNKNEKECMQNILDNGCEIGVHFDETKYSKHICNSNTLMKQEIIKEKEILEKAIGKDVNSVSMHIPSKRTLDANYSFDKNFINSYSNLFFKSFKYISDSEMRWREDVDAIIESGEYDKLHILTHPIWYREVNTSKEEIVKQFLKSKKKQAYKEAKIFSPGIESVISLNDF